MSKDMTQGREPRPVLVFRLHAVKRMSERSIAVEDVRHVLSEGEAIETYPEDTPYPSRLVLGWVGSRAIHVVVAHNADENEDVIITVYEPDPMLWGPSRKRRTR